MDLRALHLRLEEIAPAALVGETGEDADLRAAMAHAASGCSRCARALVNARETGAELIVAASPAAAPGPALRARLLAGVRRLDTRGGRVAEAPRFFDPAGEIARLHLRDAADAERIAEVDALDALLPREDDACERLLAQLSRVTSLPLLFVSVVRGERVGYRVQRGLDVRFAEMRDRRRETTFCTHTISCGAPLVVRNAVEEPFFRGSNMVRRFGVAAYVGVPLTTSRGVAIGTLCAMDFRPRAVPAAVVRAVELFAEPVLAEIEHARRPSSLARTASGVPVHGEGWMRALLDVERQLAAAPARPSSLIVARGEGAERLADLAGPDEPVGRVAPAAVALLLPGVERAAAELRAAAIGRAIGGSAAVEVTATHALGAAAPA